MTRAGGTRAALLDAALAVFNERTYGDTPVAEVAERAGVSVGTLYRYFPSKEALGNAVYRLWKQRLGERLAAERSADASYASTFAAMFRTFVGFAADHPEAFAFLELQQHEGYLDVDSRTASTSIDQTAVDFVSEGQKAGEIRAGDPQMLVALVYGALVGLVKARRTGLTLTDEDLAAAQAATWALLDVRSQAE
ncbi:TetR/AcrR family transcriptional regulator [Herbidospora sp. NBRC 101105]|uniref:TetR/AcrR family transcriptional regulator n=1 Tax=Herbidospora sp. NBRC 101105 TaxID=3032195 RepID=UPI00249F97B5|nr:TetR/AcrR family transcriptional regulator [Herbidospora sp. NBRC 101105]GLX93961.1 HTH-type transcriptional repressor FatR [Herbidospora sp. NBRC 101105]